MKGIWCVPQGAVPPTPQSSTASESDVKYPTIHKPGQHSRPQPTSATAAATDPADVQYPGIYKPDKKKDPVKVHLLL